MRRIEARRKNASAFRLRFSQLFGEPSAAIEPSDGALDDPARLGKTTNPLTRSERLTISTSRCGRAFAEALSQIAVLDIRRRRRASSKRKHPEQGRHDENAAIAILNVGRMDDGVEQKAQCVDKNVPLLALDLLARIVPVRINAGPLFRAFHALAVDDGGGRAGFSLSLFATLLIKRVVDPLQCAVIGPQDRSSRRPSFSAAGLSGSG